MKNIFSWLFPFREKRKKQQRAFIRQNIHELKMKLSHDEKLVAAEKVFSKIEESPDFQNANTVLIYWSTSSELPTHSYVKTWSKKKTVLLPTVHGKKIYLKKFLSYDELGKNENGKQEPKTEVYTGGVDLAIISGVAFDTKRNRMGRGRGFYDNFLSVNSIVAFGVGYDFQILETIPIKEGKIKMKKVFTPNGIME